MPSLPDAIEAKVLKGSEVYESLLGRAAWISDFFPVAYLKIATRDVQRRSKATSSPKRVLNRFLFYTVGKFLRLKASMLNGRLTGRGRNVDLFDVRSAEDHLVYESSRYAALRGDYASLAGAKS